MTAVHTPTQLRVALAGARAELADAERKRGLAIEVLIQTAREFLQGPPTHHAARMLIESRLAALDHWTAERDAWRTAVNDLVREVAIAGEAEPNATPVTTRARVEALIHARIFGHEIADLGDEAGVRRWRAVGERGERLAVPHYTSDPTASRAAQLRVDGLAFVRSLIDDVLALNRNAGRREVALAVLRATPFERALAVLGAAGVNPADDPTAVPSC